MSNKSAKDLAFDRERSAYRNQIHELERQLKQKETESLQMKERVYNAEMKCEELQDWVDRLLEYTELSKDDMQMLIADEKEHAKIAKHVNGIFEVMGKFRGLYYD